MISGLSVAAAITARQEAQASRPCAVWVFFPAPQIRQPVVSFFLGTVVPPDISMSMKVSNSQSRVINRPVQSADCRLVRGEPVFQSMLFREADEYRISPVVFPPLKGYKTEDDTLT